MSTYPFGIQRWRIGPITESSKRASFDGKGWPEWSDSEVLDPMGHWIPIRDEAAWKEFPTREEAERFIDPNAEWEAPYYTNPEETEAEIDGFHYVVGPLNAED